MFDTKPQLQAGGAPDIGVDYNDHSPTTMEFAAAASRFQQATETRAQQEKKQRRIDELKGFLPGHYRQRYNLI